MHGHDVIVIGTSAGGVEALTQVVSGLPRDLPASVLIVMHVAEYTPSALPAILRRRTALPVKHPEDNEPIAHGHIYVAPSRRHLLVEHGRVRLVAGPRENGFRPAIDPLFRTAALAYGSRVVGVVLTGALNDGTAGLLAIKRRGGVAVVQDPEEALISSMPANALAYVTVDHCLRLAEMPHYLVTLAHQPVAPEAGEPAPEEMQVEADISGLRPVRKLEGDRVGHLSVFTCPECNGPLWEIHDGQLLRFRCNVGHAYTSDALIADQAKKVDDALWTALETLEQRSSIALRLAERSREQKHPAAAERFESQAAEMEDKIRTLRVALQLDSGATPDAEFTDQDDSGS